jgi:hypothetical protein
MRWILTPAEMAWCTASRSTSVACCSSCCFCASHWCVTAATAAAVATGATGYTFMATGGSTARQGQQGTNEVSRGHAQSCRKGVKRCEINCHASMKTPCRSHTRDNIQLHIWLPYLFCNPQQGVCALLTPINRDKNRYHFRTHDNKAYRMQEI